MKKLLACGLILAMLSSTGAMCFANEEIDVVNVVEVSTTEIAITEESQENKTSQEELLSDIEAIKNEKGLTVKEKFERAWASVKEFVEGSVKPEGRLANAWNCAKNFVKDHCKAIGTVVGSAVFVVVLCLCGPAVFDAIKGLFSSDCEEQPKEGDKKDEEIIVEEEVFVDKSFDEKDKSNRENEDENEDVIIEEDKKDETGRENEDENENVIIEEEQSKKAKGWLGWLTVFLPSYGDNADIM